jgi:hypothetical protein
MLMAKKPKELPQNETAEPAKADQLETFGGNHHRLESSFRPPEKKSPAPRPREKERTQDKTGRKPTG